VTSRNPRLGGGSHRDSASKSRTGSRIGVPILRRLASWLLTICLLSSSTPAAPATIIAVAKETRVSFIFWWHSSGLAQAIQGRANATLRTQEKQTERDTKVARLQIFPGNATIDRGDRVRFSAIAFDSDNNAVGGVKIKWSYESAIKGNRARLTPIGEFEGIVPGSYTVIAQAAKKIAQITVTVRSGVRRNLTATPSSTREVSTRDLPVTNVIGSNEPKRKGAPASPTGKEDKRDVAVAKRAHAVGAKGAGAPAAPMFFLDDGWGDGNYWSADDPGNSVGNPPGSPIGGAGSGNFQFTAPVLSLRGRGINISLAAAYNSRLWNKAGSQIGFDNDRDWPAPGFSLGSGKMLGMGVNSGGMLIDADGTRHSYTGSITYYSWGTYGVMHTTDGSFIDYSYWTGTGGSLTSAQAQLPNGTTVFYGAPGPGALYPTCILDGNGNFITITYQNNAGPRIQTITDTLNRSITFSYDYNNLLTAISAPGLSGGTRTLIRFHYHQLALSYGFSGLTPSVRDSYPWVIDAIYYPATGTGYWFNDSDSYSSYGMLAKVVEERAMGFSSSSLNDMGSVWQGSITRIEAYNYPLSPDYGLTDAPTYTSMTETWTRDGSNFDTATTTYAGNENASPRTTIIALPNGTTSKQLSYNAPGQWHDGLVYHDETYVTEGQPLQSSDSNWELGAYGSPRPTRVQKTDERGQTTASEFTYGSVYNQVTELRDYDYGGTTLLRAVRNQYQNSSAYTNRHIFNLPLVSEVYASDYSTRVSRTEYQYDGQTLSDTPGVAMHDEASNPYAEPYEVCDCYEWDYWQINCLQWNCNWVSNYNPATDARGNPTQITNYADAINLTGAVVETARYDITGNALTTTSSCCDQTSFSYTLDTQYAYPLSQTRGSATDPYAQVTTSATYDFYTGVTLSLMDANGRQSQMSYDSASLRETSVATSTGAHSDYAYDDAAMTVTSTSYLAAGEGGSITEQNVRFLNGHGQIRQERALGPSSTWDVVDTNYNIMGQLSAQSRPYRLGVESPQFVTVTYDALDRTSTVTMADGSVMQSFYNEASRPSAAASAPGETLRVQDAWGRERWTRKDANGQLVEVVEPSPNGGGSVATDGMVTTYAYDTLGNLTTMTQGNQVRAFGYDSLRRLTKQKLAEASATLNDAGAYVGAGTWSSVFTYDDRSNLTSRTDARGVKTVYTYNNDPLNRLQSVSWDTSGFGDTGNPILAAATVTYQYRQKSSPSERKDVTQRASVTTAGVSTESYDYDTEGRVSSETDTLTSRSSYPLVTDFIYDSLDRVRDVRYPSEFGNGSSPRKVVHHDYDIAGRITGVTFDSQAQASSISYNAASQINSLYAGSGGNQVAESYSYNAQTGLLENQTVTRGGTGLLNLSYDFAGANGKRTGQLVKISNNLDHNKDRGYEYDTLGRLRRATGGQNVNWVQRYNYDRYGNRSTIYSFTADQVVRNFYQSALARQPNAGELQSWLSSLQSAYAQGATQFLTAMQSLGEAIFSSQEYANRNRSDHDYVYDLYKAYLLRDPDSGGWAFWESVVASSGRPAVRNGFAWSEEFYLKVNGTSPYSPAIPVPADGWTWTGVDSSSNRINASGFAYDADGNQVRALVPGGASQRFRYDAANRLVQVLADDNYTVLASYIYGDSNIRLATQEPGVITYYASLGGAIISEFIETSGTPGVLQWASSYVYLGARLLSKLTPNGGGGEAVEFHHPDHLSTRVVSNPATGTSFEQVHLPFGTALNAESTGGTNRRFTSYDRSASTGLDYAVNRSYDSQQGRFTQVDPVGMGTADLENPQTLNLYSYCANDPINHTDANGLGFLSFLKKLFKVINKVLKWIVIVVAIALAVVVTFALLNLPGAQFLAKLFFTALDAALKWMAKAGIMHFAEGGATIGAKTIIVGAALGGLQIVNTLAGQQKDPPGKTIRRQQKEIRRQARARRIPRVRIPGSDEPIDPNPKPPQGTPETRVPSQPDPVRQGPNPEKVRLPENASRWMRFRLGVALVLRGIGNYLSHVVIMVSPEALAEVACEENPYSDICRQFMIYLSPEKRCKLVPHSCA